jgi:hypothetical protein
VEELLELARAVEATARQHQEAIWARQQAMNRLRSLLRDYHPQALAAFCEPGSPRGCERAAGGTDTAGRCTIDAALSGDTA